jgi:hypothetical protein
MAVTRDGVIEGCGVEKWSVRDSFEIVARTREV